MSISNPSVFVTVGNARQRFRRLLEAVDRLAGEESFRLERFLIQKGFDHEFQPRHCDSVDFLRLDQFEEAVRNAPIVVCHAGAGTLIQVLSIGKRPVVMPRLSHFAEHVDDHQLELALELDRLRRIVLARTPSDLRAAIAEARLSTPITTVPIILAPEVVGECIQNLMDTPPEEQPSASCVIGNGGPPRP